MSGNIYRIKIHKVLFTIVCLLPTSAMLALNIGYSLDLTELKISFFPNWSYSLLVTNILLVILISLFFWEEIFKKWMIVEIRSPNTILLKTVKGKFVIEKGQPFFHNKTLFSKGGSGQVIVINLDGKQFQISQFYLHGFFDLKAYLSKNGFIKS